MPLRPLDPSSFAANLRRIMAVYRKPETALDSDDEVHLHEVPSSHEAKKRIVLKEFFVRAFLLEDYNRPLYNYRQLMPLIAVQLSEDCRDVSIIVESSDTTLIDNCIKWFRERMVPESDPPRGFFSNLVITPNGVEFEATRDDVITIYNFFLGPRPPSISLNDGD